MDVENILAKVRKLRALAANAGTLAEAEAAAAQAEAIIARYRLEEAQIELDSSTPSEKVDIAGEPLYEAAGHNSELWRGQLAGIIGKHYGCLIYKSLATGHAAIQIIGRPSDVQIVRYMFAWISVEIERLSQYEKGRTARNSFRQGAVVGFATTLKAAQKAATGAHQGSAAMVLADRYGEALVLAESVLKLKTSASRKIRVNGGAYERGQRAGARLNLDGSLGSGSATKRLG